jgi:hypothetical protein
VPTSYTEGMIANMPRIGIFWVYRDKVLGRAVELTAGEEGVAGLLDSPDNHAELWEGAQLLAAYPELRAEEYFAIPRGRVLWRREPPSAIVYMDARLFTDAIKGRIADFFQLAGCAVLWQTDPHYTTHS